MSLVSVCVEFGPIRLLCLYLEGAIIEFGILGWYSVVKVVCGLFLTSPVFIYSNSGLGAVLCLYGTVSIESKVLVLVWNMSG